MADSIKKQTSIKESEKKPANSSSKNTFMRIFAVFGIILILTMYGLSLVAAISDWENSFGIFTGALAATIFVPLVIYLIKFFTDRNKD